MWGRSSNQHEYRFWLTVYDVWHVRIKTHPEGSPGKRWTPDPASHLNTATRVQDSREVQDELVQVEDSNGRLIV